MPEARLDYQKIKNLAKPGFVMEAPSMERLYINAGLALTDLLVDINTVQDQERHTIVVEAPNKEGLMAAWLGEILAHYQNSGFLCRRIVFDKFDGKRIQATLRGEKYSPLRHGHIHAIKGIAETLEFGERLDTHPVFFVKVLFDYR
ncbi:MAG: archease [Bdellovibrionales bacterium]|nr:archease [Bdellovibrionales bacterium]